MVSGASFKVHLLSLKKYLFFYGISIVIFILPLTFFHPPSYVYPLFTIMALLPFTILLALDVLARLRPGVPRSLPIGPRFLDLTLFFLAISLYGSIPYFSTHVLSPADALFESLSATTTTSFTLLERGRTPSFILLWRAYQSWQGALFYLLFIVEVLRYYWGPGAETPQREFPIKFPFIAYRRAPVSFSLLFFMSITAFLFIAYLPFMRIEDALSLSFAVSSTGGVSTYGHTLPDVEGVYFVTSIGLILVSLNFIELLRAGFRRSVKEPLEGYYYLIFLGLFSLLFALRSLLSGTQITYGLFALLSASSGAGIYPHGWPSGIDDFTLYLLLLLMAIGGCTFSVTSGLKVKRVVSILRAIYRELLRAIHPRAYLGLQGEHWSGERFFLHSTIFIFFLYMGATLTGALLLIISGLGIRNGIFLALSALTNTGLDPLTEAIGINNFTPFQKFCTMVLMLVGRLEVVIPVFLFSPSLRRFARG
ncbi:MAG: hypothetical protein DRN35_03985 [Thermoplasmata archaeon]|nr:MAG: hypothetical protein DRN35_03985 [Thermoplasmata archaeon]